MLERSEQVLSPSHGKGLAGLMLRLRRSGIGAGSSSASGAGIRDVGKRKSSATVQAT
jgi:hypothetical protein